MVKTGTIRSWKGIMMVRRVTWRDTDVRGGWVRGL